MASTIVIDAGHGGTTDPGAVYQGRQEKDDNLRLALAVGRILEERGQNVIYTRTSDVYETPFQKAQKANATGADFFVSIHRNAFPMPGAASGVETLIYDDSGIKAQMAANINERLAALGFRNLGVKERPGLVVLRRTQMPAVLVEAGFIDNERDNALFDERFDDIARAIADGILDTIGGDSEAGPAYYRVQTGLYRNQSYAQNLLNELLSQGFPAFLTESNGLYAVQVGAFNTMDEAVQMERRLRAVGYPTLIVR